MGTDTQYAYYDVMLYCPQCGLAMSQPFPRHGHGRKCECLNSRCLNFGRSFEYIPPGIQIREIED